MLKSDLKWHTIKQKDLQKDLHIGHVYVSFRRYFPKGLFTKYFTRRFLGSNTWLSSFLGIAAEIHQCY